MALRHDPEGAETDALRALFPSFEGRDVLEIGCGEGRLTERYAAAARSVLAIDPDEDAIARCRDAVRGLPVDARAIDFAHFAPANTAFDVVIFSWSL
jgi:2-polyprenyl-3-methyl-5-hydroxy-6-metoxy-1,4-benzoquinol methylase